MSVGSWPADGGDVHAALSVADERLYLAKGAGRNRFVAHSPGTAAAALPTPSE